MGSEWARQYANAGRWVTRMGRGAGNNRGMALLAALFLTFSVGMMLFGFSFLNLAEIGTAGFNRNSIEALDLAEAGIQEAQTRMAMTTVIPGQTSFPNSLANSGFSPGSSGTVTFQPTVQGLSAYFPILSTATFNGSTQAVRVLEQALYKMMPGAILYGPEVVFSGDTSPVTGDVYSITHVLFQQWKKSPLCASTATATNLVSPQIMAGTTIAVNASGPNATPPCGSPTNVAASPLLYSTECADGSPEEVAPTACAGHGGRLVLGGRMLPGNWHPMTPIGMISSDFTTVVQTPAAALATLGISVVQATQSGAGVTYSPATYTPTYWATVPWTNKEVVLITAAQPFCVSPGGVSLPTPVITGSCTSGTYYGNETGGTPNPTRYVDWGLVSDDLTRGIGVPATTFFQAPLGCPTCGGGNLNGIRYVPLLPAVNVLQLACVENENPGMNVFDNMTGGPTACPNPPTTTITTSSVRFSGTKANPEALIVDNAGIGPVSITGSLGTGGENCTSNFNAFNWGMILATGDISISGNFIFSGFIYTPGKIITSGTVVAQGGIFSNNVQGSGATFDQLDGTGTVKYCSSNVATLGLTPVFFSFRMVSWQDVPLNRLP